MPILFLLFSLAFWCAVICIIRPMKPFRSRKVAAGAALGFFLGAAVSLAAVETPKEGQGSVASKGEANKVVAISRAAESKAVQPLAPKDELDRPEILNAFCNWWASGDQIEREAQKRFPDARLGTKAAAKRMEWVEAQDAVLIGGIEKKFGVDFNKVQSRAIRDKWEIKCLAMEQGRVTVTKAQAQATTREAARRAEGTLHLSYIDRLERGNSRSPFFNPDLFNTPECRTKQINGLTFVGCKLIAFGRQTRPDVYGVAIGEDGEPVIFPLGGPALARSEGIRALKEKKNQSIRLGLYTGPMSEIDLLKVAAELE